MSISIDLHAGDRRARAVLGTSVSALRLQRVLPLELELERRDGALRARVPRPLGLWLERGQRPPLRRGAIVLEPEREELWVLLEDWTAEKAARVNPLGELREGLGELEGPGRLRVRVEPTAGPGQGHARVMPKA